MFYNSPSIHIHLSINLIHFINSLSLPYHYFYYILLLIIQGVFISIYGHDSEIMMSAIVKVENNDYIYYDDFSNEEEIKLIYYSANNTTNIISKTTFMMNNLTIKGFETEFAIGGALYFQGDIYLTLSAIKFVDCTSLSGGAIAMKNNNFSTLITECVFENCRAVGKLKLLFPNV